VAKRLRSNKGKVVSSTSKFSERTAAAVTKNPKSGTKSVVVGPKKGWSKVMVKTTVGSSRKRKVISSSESEYNVEKDVLNITPSDEKKTAGKKTVQTVASVPIDKVFFHLPQNAIRWKFIYHRWMTLEWNVLRKEVS